SQPRPDNLPACEPEHLAHVPFQDRWRHVPAVRPARPALLRSAVCAFLRWPGTIFELSVRSALVGPSRGGATAFHGARVIAGAAASRAAQHIRNGPGGLP